MERRHTGKGAWQTSPIPIVFFVDFGGESAHPISVLSGSVASHPIYADVLAFR